MSGGDLAHVRCFMREPKDSSRHCCGWSATTDIVKDFGCRPFSTGAADIAAGVGKPPGKKPAKDRGRRGHERYGLSGASRRVPTAEDRCTGKRRANPLVLAADIASPNGKNKIVVSCACGDCPNHPECPSTHAQAQAATPSDGTVILPDLTAEDVNEYASSSKRCPTRQKSRRRGRAVAPPTSTPFPHISRRNGRHV
jgi:hypothetical protein